MANFPCQQHDTPKSLEGDVSAEIASIGVLISDMETYVLSLEARINCCLVPVPSQGSASASGPTPVPPSSSELHARLVGLREHLQQVAGRVTNITSRVTL